MVHLRINENEPNPNQYINFISVLPNDKGYVESARQLLYALAAQVKPVMKKHGLSVNSFEEYEWNRVFAGRNWNAGEIVEIVLRNQHGQFFPISWLLNTVCHELAHIKHMNHSKDFHALWGTLRSEVRDLRSRGYYGDGYWSSGQRLADSAIVGGQQQEIVEYPEYMCGGAQRKQRPRSLKRIRGPSHFSGAQSAKKQKPGSRVKKHFGGEGAALNEGLDKAQGTGFRKRAQSNRAREERAAAAEKRSLALHKEEKQDSISDSTLETDDSNELYALPTEKDEDRRQAILEATREGDLENYFELPDFDAQPVAGSSRITPLIVEDNSEPENEDNRVHILPLVPKSNASNAPMTSTKTSHVTRGLKQEAVQLKTNANTKGTQLQLAANKDWACLVCTFVNHPDHLVCDACGTTMGDEQWKGCG